MKTILYICVIVFFYYVDTHAQQRYAYLPEGKAIFQTSYEKLIIKYKSSFNRKQLSKIVIDSSQKASSELKSWEIFSLKEIYRNKDSLTSILNSLRSDNNVFPF